MKLKKGLKFLQFKGEEKDIEAFKKFTGAEVFIDKSMGWPTVVVKLKSERIAVFKDDYLAKHGDKFFSISEDVIKFIMT